MKLLLNRLFLPIAAAGFVGLPLCGCGGGSSSSAPDTTALLTPFVGSYTATYTLASTNTPQTFNFTLALGKGDQYGSTVPVVTVNTSDPQDWPEGSVYGSDLNYGKAYLKNAIRGVDHEQVTGLLFYYQDPSAALNYPLALEVIKDPSTGALSGEFDIASGVNSTAPNQTIILTLTKQ